MKTESQQLSLSFVPPRRHGNKFELDGIELNEGQYVEILVKDEYTHKYVWKKCYAKYLENPQGLIKVGAQGRIRG